MQTCFGNGWKPIIVYHSDLKQNSALNSRAAAEAKKVGDFGLEDFTYNNTSILKVLDSHLRNTDFLGISVRPAVTSENAFSFDFYHCCCTGEGLF